MPALHHFNAKTWELSGRFRHCPSCFHRYPQESEFAAVHFSQICVFQPKSAYKSHQMDHNLKDHPRYRDQDYWEKRYETEEHKEWLCDYKSVADHIRNVIKPEDNILVIGCGNSSFSYDLAQDGYSKITNIDYASSVIRNMKTKYPGLTWLQMDMLNLEFEPKSFRVVIEKATLDALLDGEKDPWNFSEEGKSKVGQSLTEISRVLTNDGVFVSISFAQPHFRLPLYAQDKYDWSPTVQVVGSHFHHYVYVMSKGKAIDRDHLQRYLRAGNSDQSKIMNRVTFQEDENFLSHISVNE